MPLSLGIPIIGPRRDGYKRPFRSCPVQPRLELVAIEAEDVRPKATASGELPGAVPAENGLRREAEAVGDLARGQEAVGHAMPERDGFALARTGK